MLIYKVQIKILHKSFMVLLGIMLFSILSGCEQKVEEPYKPSFTTSQSEMTNEYTIGVHPLHNPERLYEIYNPLAEYLSDKIPQAKFKIEASRSYAAYDEKLYAMEFSFALPNPYQTVTSLKFGYRVFGKMANDEDFKGIILVRKDSGINTLLDLRGKTVSFPAPTALAATMMPQYYMHTNGLNINKDIEISYVGSQESSIVSVQLGNVAAGVTWPPPWRILSKERPELREELKILAETPFLPSNGFVVSPDVPDDVLEQVKRELFTLQYTERGREILLAMDLNKFEAADNSDYQSVVEFLSKFSQTIRELP